MSLKVALKLHIRKLSHPNEVTNSIKIKANFLEIHLLDSETSDMFVNIINPVETLDTKE